MLLAIVGPPSSGKRTLAAALRARRPLSVIGYRDVRDAIADGRTATASHARLIVERGELLPDHLLGQLLTELVSDLDTVLVGFPQTIEQLESFTPRLVSPIYFAHLRASEAEIDARRAAAGLPPIAVEHPGALQRLNARLAPVLSQALQAKRLLELEATLPNAELTELALATFASTGRHESGAPR